MLYLKNAHKFDIQKVVMVNGGYDYGFRMEFWMVPSGAESPQPTPALMKKDIIFTKGEVVTGPGIVRVRLTGFDKVDIFSYRS